MAEFNLEKALNGETVEWFDNGAWHTVIEFKQYSKSDTQNFNFRVPDYENCLFRACLTDNRLRMKSN